jgi:hypothetical protein
MKKRPHDFWVLDDEHRPVPVDLMEWARRFEDVNSRIVAKIELNGVIVSTVFLGCNHQYGDGPPLLFETMIFGGPHDGYTWRYSSWDDAVVGHEMAVKKAKAGGPQC